MQKPFQQIALSHWVWRYQCHPVSPGLFKFSGVYFCFEKDEAISSRRISISLHVKWALLLAIEGNAKPPTDAAIEGISGRESQTSAWCVVPEVILPFFLSFLEPAEIEHGEPWSVDSIFNMTDGVLGMYPQQRYGGLGRCQVPWLKNELQLIRKGVWTQLYEGWRVWEGVN